jgi:uncharacterized protein
MKVLAVSDEVVPWIYSPSIVDRCAGVELVISCGDLPIGYLEFITSMLNKPCYYVRGNHDLFEIGEKGKVKTAPEGWINLDLQMQHWQHVSMAGLEGCLQYKPGAPCQYTQRDQWVRAGFLATRLALRRLDILVTHAPAFGTHDGPDHAHTGFKSFNWLIQTFKPKFLLHGHQHRNYQPQQAGETRIGDTMVYNVHPWRMFEI